MVTNDQLSFRPDSEVKSVIPRLRCYLDGLMYNKGTIHLSEYQNVVSHGPTDMNH